MTEKKDIFGVETTIKLFEDTKVYYCTCCGHELKDPTPLQMCEWIAYDNGLDRSRVSLAYRRFKKEHGN